MRTPLRFALSARRRSGLSIVEVLVALILVTVGLLAIVGSTTLALRTTLDAAHRREAAQRAASRFSILAATGCAHATSGTNVDPARHLAEQWTVTAASAAFATVTDSIEWMSANGLTSYSLTSAIAC